MDSASPAALRNLGQLDHRPAGARPEALPEVGSYEVTPFFCMQLLM